MRILLIEDDEVLLDAIRSGMMLDGFVVDAVSTLADAQEAEASVDYAAAIVDIELPDGSGLDLLSGWRRAGRTIPVLVLTARNHTRDRIGGLDSGADDYLGKPFDLDELVARVRAVARRANGRSSAAVALGDLRLDLTARTLSRHDEIISLSRREFALLETFFEQPGRIFSRSQLEERMYGWGDEVASNTVEVHVHKLRAKLGRDVIRTVRGQGYKVDRP